MTKARLFLFPLLLAMVAVMGMQGVKCQQNGTQAGNACGRTSQANLTPCANYLAGGNQGAVPACCQVLAEVASMSEGCVCQLFNSNAPFGFPIDQSRVLVLPGLCNLNMPSPSQCQSKGKGGNASSNQNQEQQQVGGQAPPTVTIPSINGVPSVVSQPGQGQPLQPVQPVGGSGSNNILPTSPSGGSSGATSSSNGAALLPSASGLPAFAGTAVAWLAVLVL